MLSIVFAYAASAVYREAARRGRNGFPHEQVALEKLAAGIGGASRSSSPSEFWWRVRGENRELLRTLTGEAAKAVAALEGNC
jgi:hypothetical protein